MADNPNIAPAVISSGAGYHQGAVKKVEKYNPEARCIKAGRRNSAGGEQRSSFTGGMIVLLFMISAGI